MVVTSHTAVISAGEFISATGAWINDPTRATAQSGPITTTQPTTLEGIEKYLGSGMIRGIGPTYARVLMRAFGDAVFDLV